MKRRAIILCALVIGACAGNPEPERAVPYCLIDCPAPPFHEIVGELALTATPPQTRAGGVGGHVVTGEQLDRMVGFRPVTLWVRVDSAGMPSEIRVAETSGSLRTDRGLIEVVTDRRLPVERAGWYRTRVEPPRAR